MTTSAASQADGLTLAAHHPFDRLLNPRLAGARQRRCVCPPQPKVNAEVAFDRRDVGPCQVSTLAADFTDAEATSVRGAVAYAGPALEIVESRIAEWDITLTTPSPTTPRPASTSGRGPSEVPVRASRGHDDHNDQWRTGLQPNRRRLSGVIG